MLAVLFQMENKGEGSFPHQITANTKHMKIHVMHCISATPWVTSEAEIIWGAWSSCKRGGFRTRNQVCDSETGCPTETEPCIFYGNMCTYIKYITCIISTARFF